MVFKALFGCFVITMHKGMVKKLKLVSGSMMVQEVEVTSTAGRSISWAERSSLAGSEQ